MLLLPACAVDCERQGLDAENDTRCRVPGWTDRDVVVHVPEGWDGSSALPLVVALHGHGGSGEGFDKSTCEEAETSGASCMDRVADAQGFAVAYPDGTAGFLGTSRSWNAGGGAEGWGCVGDPACEDGVDDLAYDDDLFALLTALLPVDPARVYATGMSNGAAMAHRLACERPGRYAAIAAVAGANQAAGWPGCQPDTPTPVLQIHGTADGCWGWDGTPTGLCDKAEGRYMGVDESMAAWAAINGCGEATEAAEPDPAADGMQSTRLSWADCAATTELVRVEGGGHTWPGGWQYLDEETIGPVTLDFSASQAAWDFFARH